MSNRSEPRPAEAVHAFIAERIGDEKMSNWGLRVGISPSVLSQWKHGPTKKPQADQMRIVAKALGYPPAVLMALAEITDATDEQMPEPVPQLSYVDQIILDPDLPEHVKQTILGTIQIYKHAPKR
jgi:transcriptional regulator with XRE-family HTH domain